MMTFIETTYQTQIGSLSCVPSAISSVQHPQRQTLLLVELCSYAAMPDKGILGKVRFGLYRPWRRRGETRRDTEPRGETRIVTPLRVMSHIT